MANYIRDIAKGAFFFKTLINVDPYGPYYSPFFSDAEIVKYKLEKEENGYYVVYDYDYDLDNGETRFAHLSLVLKTDKGILAAPDNTGVLRDMFSDVEDIFAPTASYTKIYGELIKFPQDGA